VTGLLDALREFIAGNFGDPLALTLAKLLLDLASGKVTRERVLRELQEILLDSGLAPALLRDSLTARGVDFAEAAADIAEEAKLAVKRLQGGA